jgi:hypothetical protein
LPRSDALIFLVAGVSPGAKVLKDGSCGMRTRGDCVVGARGGCARSDGTEPVRGEATAADNNDGAKDESEFFISDSRSSFTSSAAIPSSES